MTRGRSRQVRQGLRPAAATLARRRNGLAQHQRNIKDKKDARGQHRPGVMQIAFTTGSEDHRREPGP